MTHSNRRCPRGDPPCNQQATTAVYFADVDETVLFCGDHARELVDADQRRKEVHMCDNFEEP